MRFSSVYALKQGESNISILHNVFITIVFHCCIELF